jgi:hypothetical protein
MEVSVFRFQLLAFMSLFPDPPPAENLTPDLFRLEEVEER